MGEIYCPKGTFGNFVDISVCSVSGVQLARILGLEKSDNMWVSHANKELSPIRDKL